MEYAATIADDGKPHTVRILSQMNCCDSCKGVAIQFMKRFDNVDLSMISTKESRMKGEKEEKKWKNDWKKKGMGTT